MDSQIPFSGKNISLSSAEFAQDDKGQTSSLSGQNLQT